MATWDEMYERLESDKLLHDGVFNGTIEEIIYAIKTIQIHKGDDEVQHSCEDKLYITVLRYIAEHPDIENAAELAKKALKVTNISFSRWCA